MGFNNSSQILQRVMNDVVYGLRSKGIEVYMDNAVVHVKEIE